MKKLIILSLIAAVFAACSDKKGDTQEEGDEAVIVPGTYGDSTFIDYAAWEGQTLIDSLQVKDSIYVKVAGKIKAACQTKGCWMTMDAAGEELFVKFKDYSFFVPMNSAGYDATMLGWAYAETVSVREQKEHAKDAKKSDDEIAKITEPKKSYTFMAEGVIIKEKEEAES